VSPCPAAASGVVISVQPSASRKDIRASKEGGGVVPGERVRKQKVLGCRMGMKLERRVLREVSPAAGAGVVIVVGFGDVTLMRQMEGAGFYI
jgi:hypothetical protein